MAIHTRITELLGIDAPIVQEGMGPFKTSRLAAAVSEAGGLGTVSMPTLVDLKEGARDLRAHLEETLSLTSKPFAVNVGVGTVKSTGEILPISANLLRAVFDARSADAGLASQLTVLTTSGGFPGPFLDEIKEQGLIHMHKVGSTRQALKAAAAGVDVLIASGYEMGGHTHRVPIHTYVLIPNITEAVDIPVLLSGGARDGRSLAAALAMGAEGIAMGTRFIAVEENDFHPAYKQRIVDAGEGEDQVFPAFYGPARGLRNAGMEKLFEIVASGELDEEELGRWKDDALTRTQRDGDIETGLVAAGQVSSGIHDVAHIDELIPAIVDEASRIMRSLSAKVVDSVSA